MSVNQKRLPDTSEQLGRCEKGSGAVTMRMNDIDAVSLDDSMNARKSPWIPGAAPIQDFDRDTLKVVPTLSEGSGDAHDRSYTGGIEALHQ